MIKLEVQSKKDEKIEQLTIYARKSAINFIGPHLKEKSKCEILLKGFNGVLIVNMNQDLLAKKVKV